MTLPLAGHFWFGDIGLNLADEGFLWYGAQRVMQGELPLRDFQSYDIGRYLWAAGWMSLLHDDGLLALRLSNAIGWAVTTLVLVATLLHGRIARASFVLWVVAAFLLLWVPDFKWMDSFAPLLLVWAVSRVIDAPSAKRVFILGLALGTVATIGINHALYGTVGVVLLGLLLVRHRRFPSVPSTFTSLVAGTLVGFAPVIALVMFAPGFGLAYWDRFRLLSELGSTNIWIPFSQLWPAGPPWIEPAAWLHYFVLGCLFLATPVMLVWFGVRVFCNARVDPLFAGGALLAIPYAHYAYSRADVVHAVVSAVPLVIAILAFAQHAPRRWPTIAAAITALAALCIAAPEHRWTARLRWPLERVLLKSEELRLNPWEAREARALLDIFSRHERPAMTFFVGPYWPAAYAIARKPSPTWEIYLLFPSRPERQRLEIDRIRRRGVAFALLTPHVWGADLGLRRTHPLLVAYFERCMSATPLNTDALPDSRLYVDLQPDCDVP